MMTIADEEKYQQHRAARNQGARSAVHELWLPMLLFGSVGAITWAIRGTNGWGGIDGTIVPGMTWGLLWYYVCYRKGIDARGIVLWLGMGIALGGELGYGQYVSWIRGIFNVGDETIPIAPWIGYAWFVTCGIGWGAPGGVVLGWALSRKASTGCWLVRSLLMLILIVFLFNLGAPLLGFGAVEWLGKRLVQSCPWLLFPNASLGLYTGELGKDLERTVYTNTQNFSVLLWWVGAMAVAALQRDRATLTCGAVISGGFGIGFVLSAQWCLGYGYAPGYVEWWKMWELNAGFNLGLLYVVVLYWATREVDQTHDPSGEPLTAPSPEQEAPAARQWCTSGFMALAGFVLVFAAGYEYFLWTGLLLGLFYVLALLYATWTADGDRNLNYGTDRCRSVSLAFSVFLLLFILVHGATSRTGVILELYEPEAVNQYAWPSGRVALLVPAAAALVVATLVSMKRMLQLPAAPAPPGAKVPYFPERMADLLTFIGIVGAVSIWPGKIGVLYAVFLFLAIFALNRLNHRFDEIDALGFPRSASNSPPRGARSSKRS